MKLLAIVALCICSAVVYGIIHDQVTARVCVEYFTIGHPPVFNTESPTLLGLGWGVIATWWVGLMLGVPLALVAQFGSRPRKSAGDLVKPLGILLLIMACCALLSGVVGYFLARGGVVSLWEPLKSDVPADKHVPFIADMFAHLASYAVGFLGGITLIITTWMGRKNISQT